MRLVLRTNKIKLLAHTDAGHITVNINGIAVLQVPGKRPRYVTQLMDELEFFRLVHVVDDKFELTELGSEKLQEYISQGGELDHENGDGSRSTTNNTS